MKSTGTSKNQENGASMPGCPNCVNGWVLFMRPANKVLVNGKPIYGEKAEGMIEFAEPCPYCNNGRVWAQTVIKQANIPAAFYDATMDSFDWNAYGVDTSMQKKIAESFVLDFKTQWKPRGMGLYIWSRTKGSGKTFLASAICNSLVSSFRVHPKMVNVSNLIDISQKDEEQMNQIIDADVLVIDDIGQKEAGIKWVTDILYRILDARIQRKAVTIATSNYSMDELDLDDRLIDRINRMMQAVRLPEFSVRTRDAKAEKQAMLEELGIVPPSQMAFV